MLNTKQQVTSQNEDAYRSKLDPQYLAKIPVGHARTYFENNPSKRLPEYLNEDYQGKVFKKLSTCEDGAYKELSDISDIIFKIIKENIEIENLSSEKIEDEIERVAKLVLSIPDIYKQIDMLKLVQLVFKYPEETTASFLKNVSNYNNFKGVIAYISKNSEDPEVQEKMIKFILDNSPLYEMLEEKDFKTIVDGCEDSVGTGDHDDDDEDSDKPKTRGVII